MVWLPGVTSCDAPGLTEGSYCSDVMNEPSSSPSSIEGVCDCCVAGGMPTTPIPSSSSLRKLALSATFLGEGRGGTLGEAAPTDMRGGDSVGAPRTEGVRRGSRGTAPPTVSIEAEAGCTSSTSRTIGGPGAAPHPADAVFSWIGTASGCTTLGTSARGPRASPVGVATLFLVGGVAPLGVGTDNSATSGTDTANDPGAVTGPDDEVPPGAAVDATTRSISGFSAGGAVLNSVAGATVVGLTADGVTGGAAAAKVAVGSVTGGAGATTAAIDERGGGAAEVEARSIVGGRGAAAAAIDECGGGAPGLTAGSITSGGGATAVTAGSASCADAAGLTADTITGGGGAAVVGERSATGSGVSRLNAGSVTGAGGAAGLTAGCSTGGGGTTGAGGDARGVGPAANAAASVLVDGRAASTGEDARGGGAWAATAGGVTGGDASVEAASVATGSGASVEKACSVTSGGASTVTAGSVTVGGDSAVAAGSVADRDSAALIDNDVLVVVDSITGGGGAIADRFRSGGAVDAPSAGDVARTNVTGGGVATAAVVSSTGPAQPPTNTVARGAADETPVARAPDTVTTDDGEGEAVGDAAATELVGGVTPGGSAPVTSAVNGDAADSFEEPAVVVETSAHTAAVLDAPGSALGSDVTVAPAPRRGIVSGTGEDVEPSAVDTSAVRSSRAREIRSETRLGGRAAGGPRLRPPTVGRGGSEEDVKAGRARRPSRGGDAELLSDAFGMTGACRGIVTAKDWRQRRTSSSEGGWQARG